MRGNSLSNWNIDVTNNNLIGVGAADNLEDKEGLEGYIDEFAVWGVALTATDIQNLYDSSSAKKPLDVEASNLKFYYNFDSSEGTSIQDQSGNDADATFNNGSSSAITYSTDTPY